MIAWRQRRQNAGNPDDISVAILSKGSPTRPFAVRIAILAASLALAGPSALAEEGGASPAECKVALPQIALPRPCDELWVVSCRGLGCAPSEEAAQRMQYWRYRPNRWASSDRGAFLASPDELTTSFFVVGNDYTHAETIETGWFAYCRLIRQAPESAPLRFVIWSWPSDRIPGRRLTDAKIKLGRTPAAAFYMAWLADRLPDETPISMSGSSFGARIITGSLELLAGGRLAGYQLAARADRRPRHVNAVLMGAAIDNDDLWPGQPFGRSLSQVNQMLVFVNSSDRALKFYRYLFGRRSGLRAIGTTGAVSTYRLGGEADKIVSREVGAYVGPEHGAKPFFESPAVVRMMQPYLLDPPAESAVIEASR